jgi:Mor family transcriptional regulator
MSESKTAITRNELLASVEGWASEAAQDFGLPNEKADHLGTYIADQLAEHFGGSMLSFPKDRAFRIHLRDVEIYSKFTGNNIRALAKEYDLVDRAIYNIVKKMQRRYIRERQPDLF